MKKNAMAFAIAVVCVPVWAQTTTYPTTGQQATGVAATQGATQFGNNDLGGGVSFWGGASFTANDPTFAWGISSTNGAGQGTTTQAGSTWTTMANAGVKSTTSASGLGPNQVGVAGGVQQGTWMNAMVDPNNYVAGNGLASSAYNGTDVTDGNTSASGSATTAGKITGTWTPTAASILGTNASQASMNGATGTATATGMMQLGAANMIGNPQSGPNAGASVLGTGYYNGAGSQFAAGTQTIQGNTWSSLTPNSVGAGAVIQSSATGNGGPGASVTPPCGCGH